MTIPADSARIVIHLPLPDMRQFQYLVRGLRAENRYHLSPDTDRFVSNLVEYARRAKTITFDAGTRFWRARTHDVMVDEPIALHELGAPPPHLAGHGRLNPRGIPYLYVASDELTAVSEMRPWKGLMLTLAEFQTSRTLRVANFTTQPRFEQPAPPWLRGR